ncbi:hypothetical protein JMN32_18750 [Fulvivirga sp. 29W222]|uniref:Uncharacterized protein n=1 Tax=Fulvivirga marina TaxID=2494733 RepID=A0A937FYA5_9BACT|nr:hypothetical protein [Fulvivirga marina]MBL6448360.1 hypothetical protein [Fulvivirga marina]
MSSKTRSTLKIVSIILIVLWALMAKAIIVVPMLGPYMFWIVIISFILLLVSSR